MGITRTQLRERKIKDSLVLLHDFSGTFLGCLFSFLLVFPFELFVDFFSSIIEISLFLACFGVLVSWGFGVFSTLWRISSLLDFVVLIRVHGVMLCSALAARLVYHFVYPEPIFYAELKVLIGAAIFSLGSQCFGRIGYRYLRHVIRGLPSVSRSARSSLLIGTVGEVEAFIRFNEQISSRIDIIGAVLLPGGRKVSNIRGVRIFGFTNNLEEILKTTRVAGLEVNDVIIFNALLGRVEELRILKAEILRLGLSMRKFDTIELGAQSEVSFEDLLFRDVHSVPFTILERAVRGKTVLITGGGGSIGGDIAMRAAGLGAKKIILCDISELGLQTRCLALRRDHPNCSVKPVLCDVRAYEELAEICVNAAPDILIHAAALKHIDLVEEYWTEAIKTNVFGTLNALRASSKARTKVFINISTDKAVEPTSVLGLTKRCGEALVTSFPKSQGVFRSSVRFGNVLGSSGSVSNIFLDQIASGGPLTITHPDVARYFMTSREASHLVLAASGLMGGGSDIYVLNMGEQIPIHQLARHLIEWSGFKIGRDIDVIFTGLRPGERLKEKLVGDDERSEKTDISGIERIIPSKAMTQLVDEFIDSLRQEVDRQNRQGAVNLMTAIYDPLFAMNPDLANQSR